jgi:hypothetical protein
VGNADRAIGDQYDAKAVCGVDGKRQRRPGGPQGIGLTGVTRLVDAKDLAAVDLSHRGPLVGYAQATRQFDPGRLVAPHITV